MKKEKIVQLLLNIIVVFFILYLTWNSHIWLSKLWGLMAGILMVICYLPCPFQWKKRIGGCLAGFCILVLGCYYIRTQPGINMTNSVTYQRYNTQSYYYNISNRDHYDVLIYTLMRDKTAVSHDEKEWFDEYITMFSREHSYAQGLASLLDEGTGQKNVGLTQIGNMCIKVYGDLFSEQVSKELKEKTEFPQLFVCLDDWEEADEIAVMSDENYNLYLIPLEQLQGGKSSEK